MNDFPGAPSDRSDLDPADHRAIEALGPVTERRIPVYHLDEIAGAVRALAAAWESLVAPELLARLAATPDPTYPLSPAVTVDDDAILIIVTAPLAVCDAFDGEVGRLDSHSGFGR